MRVLVLTWRGDPTARQEKAKLDRNVGGLEPFLEGMPTVFVIAEMVHQKEWCRKVQTIHNISLINSRVLIPKFLVRSHFTNCCLSPFSCRPS